jgi:transaldolase
MTRQGYAITKELQLSLFITPIMSEATLLSQMSKLLTIDVDSMDPEVTTRHTSHSFSFCDMTSNQAIVQGQATRPERAHILESAIKFVKSKGQGDIDQEQMVDEVLDVLVRLVLSVARCEPV